MGCVRLTCVCVCVCCRSYCAFFCAWWVGEVEGADGVCCFARSQAGLRFGRQCVHRLPFSPLTRLTLLVIPSHRPYNAAAHRASPYSSPCRPNRPQIAPTCRAHRTACSTSGTSSSPSPRGCSATGSAAGGCSLPPPSVRAPPSPVFARALTPRRAAPPAGMLVFWIIQTICFAEYSKHGNPATGRTVIAMICTSPSHPRAPLVPCAR